MKARLKCPQPAQSAQPQLSRLSTPLQVHQLCYPPQTHTIPLIGNLLLRPRRYLNFAEASKVPLLCAHTSAVAGLAAAAAAPGVVATTAADGVLRVWRLAAGEAEPLAEFQSEERCTCSTFAPDGRHLAAGYDDGTLRLFDSQAPAIVWTVSGHESPVVAIHFHPTEVSAAAAGMVILEPFQS